MNVRRTVSLVMTGALGVALTVGGARRGSTSLAVALAHLASQWALGDETVLSNRQARTDGRAQGMSFWARPALGPDRGRREARRDAGAIRVIRQPKMSENKSFSDEDLDAMLDGPLSLLLPSSPSSVLPLLALTQPDALNDFEALNSSRAPPTPAPRSTSVTPAPSVPGTPGTPLTPLFSSFGPSATPSPSRSPAPTAAPTLPQGSDFENFSETLKKLAEGAKKLEDEMQDEEGGDDFMEKLMKEFESNEGYSGSHPQPFALSIHNGLRNNSRDI